MGRKRQGPVRINNGLTWYCRLHIPEKLRGLAGKTRLIRSLETTDHNTALKRYGHVIQQLEDELQGLLSGDTLRQKVSNYQDSGLHPAEAAELILGVKELDPSSSTHESIYNAVAFGNELPISWEELIELWITTRNRKKARDLSAESINSARTAINQIKPYGQPSELTKQSVQRFVDEFPGKATTVQTRCRMLSALMEVGIRKDRLDANPFLKVDFDAEQRLEDKRLAFSDEQLRVLYKQSSNLLFLCLSGLRPGEYCSRRQKDVSHGILSVTDEPDISWRTKNIASIRRLPIPPGFQLTNPDHRVATKMTKLQKECKQLFNDKRLTPHSGRHKFYELSRRAGCDPMAIEAITGHAQKRQSSQYGSYSDDVLLREISKVWEFVNKNIINNNGHENQNTLSDTAT